MDDLIELDLNKGSLIETLKKALRDSKGFLGKLD